MKLGASLFAALLVLLAAQRASAQSSYPNRPAKSWSAFHPARRPTLPRAFLASGLRKSGARPSWSRISGRRRQHRHRTRRQGGRRRLHAADGRQFVARHQSEPVRNTAVRPVKDFAPISQVFIAANVLAVPTEGRSRPWRNWWRSPRRSPASSPTPMPASAPRSTSAANCSNTWRMSISHRYPIAAPQRSCRTCSRAGHMSFAKS